MPGIRNAGKTYNMQSHWPSYFLFSKNERIALAIFMVLMGAFITAPYWYQRIMPASNEQKRIQYQLTQYASDTLLNDFSGTAMAAPDIERNPVTFRLHPFNPNTSKEEDWIAMGLPAKTARTILRYVNKGGRFTNPNDLKKIWGIRASDVDRLLPYIRLEKTGTPHQMVQTFTPAGFRYSPIEINTADSAAWASLPGIGKVLSKRIVHYRQRLGGFRSVEDLRKVYGLADSVYTKLLPYLQIMETEKGKPNLNTVTPQRLAQIGGIEQEIAEAIVVYRQQNGPFENFNGLRQLVFINDSLLAKLRERVLIQ
jgi:competence ComEA-like helix-hairpin-helix protein